MKLRSINFQLSSFIFIAALAAMLSGCATPIDARDPALYRPAPAHYPPLP